MNPRIPAPEGHVGSVGTHRLGPAYQPRLHQALHDWQAAVVRLDTIDAVTTELVRLRCARVHDCAT